VSNSQRDLRGRVAHSTANVTVLDASPELVDIVTGTASPFAGPAASGAVIVTGGQTRKDSRKS